MSNRRKVLIVSPVSTHPPHRGNRQRILQMAELFRSSQFDVELAIGRNRKVTPEAREFWPTIHRLKVPMPWKPTSKNVGFDSWYKEGLGEQLARVVEEKGADIVLLNYVFHSKVLEFLPNLVVKLIDTHDVFTNRRELYVGYRYTGGFFSCLAEDEKRYLERADGIISISPPDTSRFNDLEPRVPVFDIPFLQTPVLSDVSLESARITSTGSPAVREVGILMSANDLNLASLHSLVAAVDDLYGGKPPFVIRVAGEIFQGSLAIAPHRIPAFSRRWLKFVGPITNVEAFYDSVSVVAIPVLAGSGMAVKFSEAITHGVPTMSTVAGSRGHVVTHPLHSLDNNWELASRLGALTAQELEELRHAGQLLVRATKRSVETGWQALSNFMASRLP